MLELERQAPLTQKAAFVSLECAIWSLLYGKVLLRKTDNDRYEYRVMLNRYAYGRQFSEMKRREADGRGHPYAFVFISCWQFMP
jgi:hypothetical protein